MYATATALTLDENLVRAVVSERLAWEAASLTWDAAAERIGWHWRDIERMGAEGRITQGKGGRYLVTDVDALAAEADGEQYITAQTAAEDVLEIRHPADWKYVEAAGWITPATTYEREVGRHRTVTVALYRLADVRAVRDMPGVDFEAVRGPAQGRHLTAARGRRPRPHPGRRGEGIRARTGRPARYDGVGLELPVLRGLGAGLGARRRRPDRG
ncbi:hypothetical protein ACIRP7_36195 [Streptomyces sp. NPDC102270]|uniref:hypothetical protein n=1 Tax=Streptomyces sp. NPDC102270 TaxID=3366150 RepID=UPI0037FA3A8B